jgi:hypothetical protein
MTATPHPPLTRGSRCGGVGVVLIASCDERRRGLLRLLAGVSIEVGHDHPDSSKHGEDQHELIKKSPTRDH